LSSNTWGLNSEDTSTYVGLPAYANATNTALTSKSSVSEESTVPIYYGLKVDTSITPGTYTGDVLYTVLPDSACTVYTVRFNANGGTGTMSNQTITVGTATNLSANAFTRSGYTFLGWDTDSSATTPTYSNQQSVTDLTTSGNTIDLYAIWAPISGNMQSWTGCSSLSASQQIYLQDTRDNRVYSVKKLPDDKCWMTMNLALGMDATTTGLTLTSSDTNIDNSTTYYLPPAGKQGSITSSSTLTSTTAANFSPSGDNQARTKFRTKNSSYTNDSDTSYYNFYTATLGFSYYNDGKTSGSSTRDICPKGWRLPKVTDDGSTVTSGSAAEFTALAKSYNSSASWTNTSTAYNYYTTDSDIHTGIHNGTAANGNNYAGFSYSGYWSSTNTSASNLDSSGNYWPSSVYDANYGYRLSFGSSGVYPQYKDNKYFGNAVRCVAQNSYTINYSSNGTSSGSPSKTTEGTVYESGSITTAAQGTMVKSGYNFLGWALTSGATTATYSAEASVSLSDLLSAASAAGQTTTSGSTITLYPVWEQSVTYMQGWTGCSALSESEQITLVDSRDNHEYTVKKLPDGKCWMTQNLTLGDSNSTSAQRTLTPDNTNIDNNTTYYLPPAGKQGSITSSSTLTSTTAANFGTSNDNYAKTQFRTKSSSYTNDSDTGYYNFYTATLGYSYYGSGSSGSSTRDICPKGWRLPKVTDGGSTVTSGSVAEFTALAKSYNSSASWTNSATSSSYNTSDSDIHTGIHNGAAANGNNYAGFSYSGYWYSTNTSASSLGSYGYYWSSSVYGTVNGYRLLFSSSAVYPQDSYYKYYGYAVRCVAKDTMQENTASSLPENETTTLRDSRDNQSYTVYRWPSTGTAGTDYPTSMAGYAIMTKDLSLGYVTGGSITKGSNLTLTTSDSAAAGTITARTGTSDLSTTDSDDNLQYINGTGGTYDSHSYYSYGAAQKVCPKGWRPPTQTEYANIATFMGGNNANGSAKIRSAPYNFVYGGYFLSSGWTNVGSNGNYWSSTQGSSTDGRYLTFGSSSLYTFSYNKYYGRSVRCVSAP
ncbi:InlB B-repeat-containing protein, partial [Candidatus Saccharibacteria bacterium]|nr:InlB B-repeat-containing protein [Candidatus Saccharibacteria bacterium]